MWRVGISDPGRFRSAFIEPAACQVERNISVETSAVRGGKWCARRDSNSRPSGFRRGRTLSSWARHRDNHVLAPLTTGEGPLPVAIGVGALNESSSRTAAFKNWRRGTRNSTSKGRTTHPKFEFAGDNRYLIEMIEQQEREKHLPNATDSAAKNRTAMEIPLSEELKGGTQISEEPTKIQRHRSVSSISAVKRVGHRVRVKEKSEISFDHLRGRCVRRSPFWTDTSQEEDERGD
jgi:hypothetical protein